MALISFAALGAALMLTGAGQADIAGATDLCLDSRIRKAAAEQIGTWSENYPFARVIIGSDGQYGFVGDPSPAVVGSDFVVCSASYRLTKVGRDAKGYSVTMDRFYFRVTLVDGDYQVTLEDLPASLDGSNITSRELIGRFKVNDRPYAVVLSENQRRIAARRQ